MNWPTWNTDGGRVSGPSVVTDETTIQLLSPATGQPLVMPRPGARLVGRALEVTDQVLTFIVDGHLNAIDIPLPAIGKLEVSDHRTPRHVGRGVLVGVGIFYGTLALIFFGGCGLDCSNAALLPPMAVGIAAGTTAGRSRETWKVVPTDWLRSNTRVRPTVR